MMNAYELQALRHVFAMTIDECVSWISDLTDFQSVYRDGSFLDWKIYQSVAAELYAHDLERLC